MTMAAAYYVNLSALIGIGIILALSVNVVSGVAGQISFGHAAFFGIGAYASAILTTRYGLTFWLALPAAGIVTAGVGALVGLPSVRVRGDFLAILSIGVNFVVVALFLYTPFFGGAMGISAIPPPRLFGNPLGLTEQAVLIAVVAVGVVLFVRWVTRVWAGLAFLAVREDEDAAESLGIPAAAFKVLAFTLSTGLAGLAGSLYAHHLTIVTPEDFGFVRSIEIFVWAAFGGLGTIRGPILGATLLGVLPELFRVVQEYRMSLYGAVLVVIMVVEPAGLLGDESRLWRALRRRGRSL